MILLFTKLLKQDHSVHVFGLHFQYMYLIRHGTRAVLCVLCVFSESCKLCSQQLWFFSVWFSRQWSLCWSIGQFHEITDWKGTIYMSFMIRAIGLGIRSNILCLLIFSVISILCDYGMPVLNNYHVHAIRTLLLCKTFLDSIFSR